MAVSGDVDGDVVEEENTEENSETDSGKFNLQIWINEGLEGGLLKHATTRTIKALLELSWASLIAAIFLLFGYVVTLTVPSFSLSLSALAGGGFTLALAVYTAETNCKLSQTK